jgi:hypothetical protein
MRKACIVSINSSDFRTTCYNKPLIRVIRLVPGIGAGCLSSGVSGSHDTFLLTSFITLMQCN